MNNPEQLIIFLDIFAFLLLLAFFILLFKSSSLFIKKNNGRIKFNVRRQEKEYFQKVESKI